jgi:hypothetical protein
VQADYQLYDKPGTGVIAGKRTGCRDGAVFLNPITPYSAELHYRHGIYRSDVRGVNKRARRYQRIAVTAPTGEFRFDNLPEGDYYVACRASVPLDLLRHMPDAYRLQRRGYDVQVRGVSHVWEWKVGTASASNGVVSRVALATPERVRTSSPDLWDVSAFGKVVECRALLRSGADPNIRDSTGNTFLALRRSGAGPNTRDSTGNTPLLLAASLGHRRIVKLLVAHGADVNARNTSGVTALHAAAENGHARVVVMLVKYGADPVAKDQAGETSLHKAQRNGHRVTVDYLLEIEHPNDRRGHARESESRSEARRLEAEKWCRTNEAPEGFATCMEFHGFPQ